jgi:hypothetical protein
MKTFQGTLSALSTLNTINPINLQNPGKSSEEETCFTKGRILIIDKIVYKKTNAPLKNNRSMNLSPIPKGFLASRFKYDDSYSYVKFMKSHDVTPFNKIISITRDTNFSVFPYLAKIAKEIKKTESAVVVKRVKKPKAYIECLCTGDRNCCFYREKPQDHDIFRICDSPEVKFVQNFSVLFEKNFIFVIFEGVVGIIKENMIKLRKGALKFLKRIQNLFKIVIICTFFEISKEILKVLENKKIKVSVVLVNRREKSNEFIHLGKVFQELLIENPESQVLIVASLDLEVQKDDPIFPKLPRLTQNLNIKSCPISNSREPTIFLVPNLLLSPTSKPFENLLSSLKSKIIGNSYNFLDWQKTCRGKLKVISSSLPYEKVMEKMPLKKQGLRCKLHKTMIRLTEELPHNYFVIYFD